ncbi:MAG: DNA translocase FtsK [Hyphomicrobiaceae bacterium]|nr:DNA translocase FtsK [Hyphomicrobiaceae bacterium]
MSVRSQPVKTTAALSRSRAPQNGEPDGVVVAFKIPLRLIGIGVIALTLMCLWALATWSVDDPSLSLATDKAAENGLGYAGAVVADLFMQFFGLASLLTLVAPAIWGYRLMRRSSPSHWVLRVPSWIGSVVLAAAALSFVPAPESWPLPSSLGGLSGDLFNMLVGTMTGGAASGGFVSVLFALLFLPATAALFWLSVRQFAAKPRANADADETDEDRTGWFDIAFGALFHLGLSMRTAWGRTRARFAERFAEREEDWSVRPDVEGAPAASDARTEPEMVHALSLDERREPTIDDDFVDASWQGASDEDLYPEDDEDDYVDVAPASPDRRPAALREDHDARLSVESGRPSGRAGAPRATPQAQIRPGKRISAEAQGSLLGDDGFQLPELALLSEPPASSVAEEHLPQNLEANARQLESVLQDFGVKGDIINVRPGPVVTLYELEPAPGIKSSRVISLADDIARSMSAVSARVAVVAGRNAIGIELPNKMRETVYLREMLASSDFEKIKGKLPICLGKTIGGEPVIADLARMPHLLIAGTTGSGKSVAVNTMILSLLYRMSPEECRLIMIDPKMLELSVYDGIPHLLTPVVTDPGKAVMALKWAVREMEDRYRKMSKIGVRNIDGFNKRVVEANAKGEVITRTVQTGFDRETGEPLYESETFDLEPLPFIVVIVDEMADLMMVAGKDIEGAIQRLAQMARAAGIHLIMATQRPSVDVITGTIKANFPTRISFQVTSKIDSRTILGEQGAEQLLGMGDMLYMAGGGRIKRLHGPFVDDGEVESVVRHLKDQGAPDYLESVTEDEDEFGGGGEYSADGSFGGSGDELYDKAVNIVLNDRKASTSYIQRRLSIGYNRAATLIERMEQEGVISPANHAGKREVLVGDDQHV